MSVFSEDRCGLHRGMAPPILARYIPILNQTLLFRQLLTGTKRNNPSELASSDLIMK